MDLLKELNDDKKFKFEIPADNRQDFATIIATWNETKYDITKFFKENDDDDDCKENQQLLPIGLDTATEYSKSW